MLSVRLLTCCVPCCASSAATEANAGARADDPLLVWSGTISGDVQLNYGDPAAGAISATVRGMDFHYLLFSAT